MQISLGKKIIQLRESLQINQAELGRRLGVSAMAVSRWERNVSKLGGNQLIKFGNLAHEDADSCWYFWNLAGLATSDVVRVLPIAAKRLQRTIPILQFVETGARKSRQEITADSLVAIPFLDIVAAAGSSEKGSSNNELTSARSERVIAAPKLWCPNPTHTVCMRVRGKSMEPTLFDGYIVVVDQQQTDTKMLSGEMIVAHHEKSGLVVSRFWQSKDSQALVSDNRSHGPVPLSPSWSIVGKVLWFIGECKMES